MAEADDMDLMSDESSPDYGSRWEGYSQYEWVSREIASSINEAIEAYCLIDSVHAEGAPMQPAIAAKARSRLLTAGVQLLNEMENDREDVEFYDEALDRWEGDDGYLAKLSELSLAQQCPGWLLQFAMDIRKAGWELGYLKAGRQQRTDTLDQDQEQVRAMFE